MEFRSPAGHQARDGMPGVESGLSEISVNGKLVLKNGKEGARWGSAGDRPAVKFIGADSNYFLFTVRPGKWSFISNPTGSSKTKAILSDEHKKTLTLSDSSGDLLIRLNYAGGGSLDKIVGKGGGITGNWKAVYLGLRWGG